MPSELTFRAQLVLREQRQLYDYWCRQAGWKGVPGCRDFDVNDIPSLSPSLSLLKVHGFVELSAFYSAGSKVEEVYGRGIKGKTLTELHQDGRSGYWNIVYSNVVKQCRPRQGAFLQSLEGVGKSVIFWLRLPLSMDGDRVTDILCHDYAYSAEPRNYDYMPGFNEDIAIAL